jgi:Flp pilus assembly protein TadB
VTPVLAALFGAGVGSGVFVVIRSLIRDRTVPLSALGVLLSSSGTPVSELDADPGGRRPGELSAVQAWLGRLGARLLDSTGVGDTGRLRDQLRVLDRSLERHCYEKVLGAVAGFSLPVITGVVLVAGGVRPPVVLMLLVSVLVAAAGFVYPDLLLADRVAKRRRAFRHALSSYLDLVTIMMAGGAGLRSALEGAADAGDGWAFAEIRGALRRAETSRRSIWEVFEELSAELGVDELRELSASIALAGESGAKIKDSLSAKADAMRAAQAAQLEAEAESQTEKMIVPVVVLIVGLVLFIGYGAMQAVTSDGAQFNQSIQPADPPPFQP